MQWSTGKAGDFLITAWLEDCEVGGCAKACSVQVNAPHSSGGFVLVPYLSHSLLTCPAPAQVGFVLSTISLAQSYSHALHQLRWLCAGTISLAQSTHMPRTSSGSFVLVLCLSHSLLTCPAPAQVALCWYYISRTVYSHAPHQLRWLCAGTISLAQSTHMPCTSSGGFVPVLHPSQSLFTW